MEKQNASLLEMNPKVDQRVVDRVNEMEKQISSQFEKQKKGADYNLAPAFGGKTFTIARSR